MNLNENITFNFSDSFFKDVNALDELIKNYLIDREKMYEELFCSEESYTNDDIDKYIDYFMTPSTDLTQNVYENLYHIQNFFNRDYEIYIQDEINSLRNKILSLISGTTYQYETFEEDELKNIIEIKDLWEEFKVKTAQAPLLDLDKMDYKNVYGVQCYFDNPQFFVQETFDKFMNVLHKNFPNVLLKLDTIVIVPKDYIEFVGGEGTQAFFTDNALFLANSCDKEDKEEKIFYELVLYHELGHFIFSLLSETSKILWSDLYKTWREKDVKMTRDDDRNSQLYDEDGNESGEFKEELWADTFATLLYGEDLSDKYYIHKPSALISNSVKFILDDEFN